MENKKNEINSRAFDELVEDLGIDSFSEDEKEKLLSKLTEIVLKRVFVQSMEKLGESGRGEYAKFLENNPDSEELKSFFSEKIQDFEGMIDNVIDDMREEMANGI